MNSKYTRDERLEIGRRIFEGEMNQEESAVLYEISPYTARDYFRLYKATLAVKEKLANGEFTASTNESEPVVGAMAQS